MLACQLLSSRCRRPLCSIVPVAAAAADVCTVLACGLRDNFSSQAKVRTIECRCLAASRQTGCMRCWQLRRCR